MQRTSVIQHRKDTGRQKRREREEIEWVMRLHFFSFFSWDKWVNEINEQSPRPKQIKHKSCSRTYAANTLTRLWAEHEFQENWQRRFTMNLNAVFIRDYKSNTTKGHLCLTSLSLSQFSHFSVTFHHFITCFIILLFCSCNVLCFLVYIHLLSMQW